ncbi:hypothetical protein D3C85_1296180 [compost metagenome]
MNGREGLAYIRIVGHVVLDRLPDPMAHRAPRYTQARIDALQQLQVRSDLQLIEGTGFGTPRAPGRARQKRCCLRQAFEFAAPLEAFRAWEVDHKTTVNHLVRQRLGGFILVHGACPEHVTS